jgi:beta-N-acetylhexosaminidase
MAFAKLNDLTLREKIGQMLVVGFDGYEINDHIIEVIKNYKIGNIILFARNIKSAEQLYQLNLNLQKLAMKEIGFPLFITIDQEGGMVTRIYNDATFFPGNMTIAATNQTNNAYEVGKMMAQELKALGINFNLAPVLDVNSNPQNPVIGVRSYSDNPQMVADFGVAYVKGLQDGGVIATGKHFPGHGDTAVDSHLDLSAVVHGQERLEQVELYPFKKAIEAGIDAIMSAHVLFPAYETEKLPGTLSKNVLTGLLREKLGFKGIITTDCMQMKAIDTYYVTEKAAILAVNAGADIVMISHSLEKQINAFNNLIEAVQTGVISEAKIDESVERLIAYKEKYCSDIHDFLNSNYEAVKADVLVDENKQFAKQLVDQALTLVKSNGKVDFSKRTLLLASDPFVTTIADDAFQTNSIVSVAKKAFPNWSVLKMDVKPTDEFKASVLNQIENFDQIIVCTYNANVFTKQAELVNAIAKTREDLLVCATRNPYDVMAMENVQNYLCLYEYTANSVSSLMKYFKNELTPSGTLPIEL